MLNRHRMLYGIWAKLVSSPTIYARIWFVIGICSRTVSNSPILQYIFPFVKHEQYLKWCLTLYEFGMTEDCSKAMVQMNLKNILLWNILLVKNINYREELLRLRPVKGIWAVHQVPPVFLPGLPSKPYYDSDEIPQAPYLLSHAKTFECEFLNYFNNLDKLDGHYVDESSRPNHLWKTIFLFMQGEEVVENTRKFPVSRELILKLQGISKMFILFSVLEPGAQITEHTGPINGFLRIHIPISIPKGDCFLEVAGERKQWKKEKLLVFDDSFVHQAWNRTESPRVVLIVSIYNPLLTQQQQKTLVRMEELIDETMVSKKWARNNLNRQKWSGMDWKQEQN